MQEVSFFSIVIPTFKRPQCLADCLQALTRLNYPRHRFEVLVVDDGSGAPPEQVIRTYRGHLDLKLLVQAHSGPAAARNLGATQAKGDFLAFTDDDCQPTPDWLSALDACLIQAPGHLVGGRTLNGLPDNLYATASQSLVTHIYDYYHAGNHNRARFFTSNNLALATARFLGLSGFDTGFNRPASEDREFCDRWLHHGYRMQYVPGAVIYHAHALTFTAFWRQHFAYGRGAALLHAARTQRGERGFKLEPSAFYRRMLYTPFAHGTGWRAPVQALLLLTAQVANAVGYFWGRASRQGS